MEDKLILLVRKHPDEYEIHYGEVNMTRNLIMITKNKGLAEKIVRSYNEYEK